MQLSFLLPLVSSVHPYLWVCQNTFYSKKVESKWHEVIKTWRCQTTTPSFIIFPLIFVQKRSRPRCCGLVSNQWWHQTLPESVLAGCHWKHPTEQALFSKNHSSASAGEASFSLFVRYCCASATVPLNSDMASRVFWSLNTFCLDSTFIRLIITWENRKFVLQGAFIMKLCDSHELCFHSVILYCIHDQLFH